MLHLCAAGGWIGGLVPLTVFLVHVRASFSLGETVARECTVFYAQFVLRERFVISGISNSWLLVGSIYALFTTPYRLLLLFKLSALRPSSLVSASATGFSLKQSCSKAPAEPGLVPLNCIEMCSAKSALVSQWSRSLRV